MYQHRLPWFIFALLLLVAPLIFTSSSALSLLSQMGTMMLLCLSYNMLLGQGGMLSFGHAVYSGLGAFAAVHVMNCLAGTDMLLPVALMPLVGGIAGMCFGVLFGYLTTRRAGTTFAMITLGIAELVSAGAMMFPDTFGGESGISSDRMIGQPLFGITFGPQIEVYYLIAFWLFVSAIAMYAWTQTPLGRMMNAVRDNPQRAAFVGYNPQKVRYITMIAATFFAGIAGGLSAVNFEIVSAENLSVVRSGIILLFTYIGGIGYFFGPVIGAAVGVFFSGFLSGYTKAWQLYLGIFFIVTVMCVPGGLARLIEDHWRIVRSQVWRAIWKAWLLACTVLVVIVGASAIVIEMLYALTVDRVSELTMAGVLLQADSLLVWGVTVLAGLVASWLLTRCLPALRRNWPNREGQ